VDGIGVCYDGDVHGAGGGDRSNGVGLSEFVRGCVRFQRSVVAISCAKVKGCHPGKVTAFTRIPGGGYALVFWSASRPTVAGPLAKAYFLSTLILRFRGRASLNFFFFRFTVFP
jgi:hypothetical protein